MTYSLLQITCESILSMCHRLRNCDANVSLTEVPCLYLKNIIARGLSILKNTQ